MVHFGAQVPRMAGQGEVISQNLFVPGSVLTTGLVRL